MKRHAMFIALFVVATALASALYTRGVVAQSVLVRADEQFREAPDSIEVLILGDSHSQYAVDPGLLPNAFNFSSAGENYAETYYKLRHVLNEEPKAIRTVILPVDLHSFSSYKSQRQHYSFYWVKYVDFIELGLEQDRLLSSAVRYPLAWLFSYAGESRALLRVLDRRLRNEAAHTSLEAGFVRSEADYSAQSDPLSAAERTAAIHFRGHDSVDPVMLRYFRRAVVEARARDVRVVAVRYPVTELYLSAACAYVEPGVLDRQVAATLEGTNVTIVDMRDLAPRDLHLFADSEHLNGAGAQLVTRRLVEHLADGP